MNTNTKHPILLVDDEPDVLYSLKGLLRREFQLFTAESGQEALEILRENDVHVIMTDQRMPGLTGVELMGHTRSQHPDAIRIVFTGYADIKAVVEAINNGGLYRYITKPWDPDELIETLHLAAAHYEKLVNQRQLCDDLHEYLSKVAQHLASKANGQEANTEFIEQANALKSRLPKVLASSVTECNKSN